MPQASRAAQIRRWLARHDLLIAVTLLALAVRLVWNLKVHPPSEYVYSDMGGYVGRADRLLADPLARRPDEAFFPFGAHYLLAAVKAVFGKGNTAATAIYQAVIGALAVTFMTAMSQRLSGYAGRARGALRSRWIPGVVGLVGALYYPLVSYGGYHLSEAPYAFFLSASALLTLRLADDGRRGDAWLLGLTLGLAATVRPQILMSLPFLGALWLVRRRELRRVRLGLLLRAAIPLAVVLALSAARAHYHTGRYSVVAQNGAVNRVFGRCHNVKTGGTRSWFGPPPLGALLEYGKRHPNALIKLDPAMGLELNIKGFLWEEDKLHALADRCVQKTGWLKQAEYAAVHAVLLWGYNTAWPDMGQPRFRSTMRAWNGGAMILLLPPLVAAFFLGLRRRFARHGLLGMHLAALCVVAMLYFGDTRLRTPYDAIFIVLAIDIYARLGRWLLHRAAQLRR